MQVQNNLTQNLNHKADVSLEKLLANVQTAPGLFNFLVAKTDGESMLDQFAKMYESKLSNTYFVPVCVIKELWQKINEKQLTGVRIVNGARKTSTGFINFIYFVGTYTTAPHKHPEAWDQQIKSDCGHQYFFPDQTTACTYSNDFETYCRFGLNMSLSKSVWISSSVFALLAYEASKNLDLTGIHIKQAAYLNWQKDIGQEYQNQSTFILVPIVNGQEDWNVFDATKELIMVKSLIAAAFNHGELCPKYCD